MYEKAALEDDEIKHNPDTLMITVCDQDQVNMMLHKGPQTILSPSQIIIIKTILYGHIYPDRING